MNPTELVSTALAVTLIAFCLSGCDQADVIIEPEQASQAELLKRLNKYRGEKIVDTATYLDQPASYYLEISNSNNKQYSTNSRELTLQVRLSPGRKITLAQQAWQSSPWRHYQGLENNKLLELELSEDLQLSINIRNTKNNTASMLNGRYQLQENTWIKLIDNQKITSNKIFSTRNKKQLWLRLHPVEIETNNQSQ